MYCRCFLLLLTLFAATVISQDGDEQCLGAFVDLAANGPCNEANEKLNDAIDANTTISMEILNAFCTPSCRALYNRALSACADLTDASRLYCTVYEGVSCYDVTGPTFPDGLYGEQFLCAVRYPTDSAQTCSPECMMTVQNFINAGGCCYVELLDLLDRSDPNVTSANEVGDLLSACPDFNNRIKNTCQVFDGSMTGSAAGLVASGKILLISIIIVMVSLLVLNSL